MKIQLEKNLTPGQYEAEVVRFEEMDSKYGTALKIIYETSDGQEINELMRMKYSSKTKLGKRVQEILGDMPEQLDLNELIGKRVIVTLIENEKNPDFPKVSSVQQV